LGLIKSSRKIGENRNQKDAKFKQDKSLAFSDAHNMMSGS
jgi:hypothetical protein